MATIKKTYRQIAQFDREARQYLARKESEWRQAQPKPEEGKPVVVTFPGSKFTWAINRMLKRCQAVIERYQGEVEDINILHAATDEKGILLSEPNGQFKFKPDELIKRNKEQRDLFNSETEIEPYHAREVPEDLSENDRETFEHFVIPAPASTE